MTLQASGEFRSQFKLLLLITHTEFNRVIFSVCVCFITACVDSRVCLLRKGTLFLPQGHGRLNKSLIHVWMLEDQAHHGLP